MFNSAYIDPHNSLVNIFLINKYIFMGNDKSSLFHLSSWKPSRFPNSYLSIVAVAESVEYRPHVWEIRSSAPGRVKQMSYQIYTCRLLAWRWALIGKDKDWLAQCQDNINKWDMTSPCCRPDFSGGQHYEFTVIAHCHRSVDVKRT